LSSKVSKGTATSIYTFFGKIREEKSFFRENSVQSASFFALYTKIDTKFWVKHGGPMAVRKRGKVELGLTSQALNKASFFKFILVARLL